MSSPASWLRSREPAPPAPLAAALSGIVSERPAPGSQDRAADGPDRGPTDVLTDVLTAHARERLERAVAKPGRERESAYRLLEADALLTYACEAALEEVDRDGALRRVLTIASPSR